MTDAAPSRALPPRFLGVRRQLDQRPWLGGVFILGTVVVVAAQVFLPSLAFLLLGVLALGIGLVVSPRNEVTGITILLCFSFLLPANLVIGPLGQAGVPSMVLALTLLLLWIVVRCAPDLGTDRKFQPLRVLALFAVLSMLASYMSGQIRGLSGVEASGANAALLGQGAALGILLFTADSLSGTAAVRKVLQRVTYGAAFLAVVASLQFFSVIDLAKVIRIPGFTVHSSTAEFVESRSGFNRVAGLATHPIEYGVVLSMALPLALHLALTAKDHKGLKWTVVAVIAGGIPLSIGRSAVLASAVALSVYLVRLRLRVLLNLLPIVLVGVVGMQVAVPGLLGSIKSLFTGASNDPSIAGRTDDYAAVFVLWRNHPVFGIGPGTYIPKVYRVLDNEYLYELVTVGVVGVIVGLALFATGYSLARRVARQAVDPEVRGLGQALAGSIAAAAVAAFTFDALGFAIMFVVTHLMVGCAAALWRTAVRDDPASGPSSTFATRAVRAPRDLAATQPAD